jgi:Transposase DDE domain
LVDPDSELITATTATAGNVGDAAAAPGLLAELIDQVDGEQPAPPTGSTDAAPPAPQPAVYGDSAYGTGPLLERLHAASIDPFVKVQAPVAPGGHFTKDQFQIDLAAGTVTCPAQRTAAIVYSADPRHRHHGQASFGPACASCPLGGQCTSAAAGRTITITAYEAELVAARARQADAVRAAWYRATRPKVERKLAHLVRRRHGGRRVRSAALPRSPPTSTWGPPRSTWPGWACSACTGRHRMAGQQPEPTRHADQRQLCRSAPVAPPEPTRPAAPRPPTHAGDSMPDRSAAVIPISRFTPATQRGFASDRRA